MPVTEETYRFKAEIDQQSLQQQLAQLRLATAASMQLQSPSMTQNIAGQANTMYLGFNTVMSDLSRSAAMLPPTQYNPSSTLMNLSLGQSAMGATMGWGAPNTMRTDQWEQLTMQDMRHRISAGSAAAVTSAAETAFKYAPAAMAGYAAMYGAGPVLSAAGVGVPSLGMFATGAGLTALTGGGLGASMLGGATMGAGLGVLGVAGLAQHAAGQVGEQVSTQSRIESMLFASSAGRMGAGARGAAATGIRGMLNRDSMLGMSEGMELLAYGTQEGLLSADRDAESYQRNYKALLKSVKTIMTTFHQSVKDAVGTMSELRRAGVLDIGEMGQEGLMMESRAALAGMTPSQMLHVGQTGAQALAPTRLGGQVGRKLAISLPGAVKSLEQSGALTQETLFNLTRTTGTKARAALTGALTQDIGGFFESDKGMNAMMAVLDEKGEIDRDKLSRLMSGRMDSDEMANNIAATQNRLGDVDIRASAKAAMKGLSGFEAQKIAGGYVTSVMTETGEDPGNRALRREIYRSWGWSKGGAELGAQLYGNSQIFREQTLSDTMLTAKNDLDKRNRDNSMETAVKRGFSGLYGDIATPFAEAGDAIGDVGETAINLWRNRQDNRFVGGVLKAGERYTVGREETGKYYTDELFGYDPTFAKSRRKIEGQYNRGEIGWIKYKSELAGLAVTTTISPYMTSGKRRRKMEFYESHANIIDKILSDPGKFLDDRSYANSLLGQLGNTKIANEFMDAIGERGDLSQTEIIDQMRRMRGRIERGKIGKSLGTIARTTGVAAEGIEDPAKRRELIKLSQSKKMGKVELDRILEITGAEGLQGITSIRGLRAQILALQGDPAYMKSRNPEGAAGESNFARTAERVANNTETVARIMNAWNSAGKVKIEITP